MCCEQLQSGSKCCDFPVSRLLDTDVELPETQSRVSWAVEALT